MGDFAAKEFKCKCGKCDKDFNDIRLDAYYKLVEARKIAGVPFIINSAMRCPDHNKAIGGSDTSSHVLGYAFDIACTKSQDRFLMVDALLKAGFHRIGIAKDFIHADDDPNKSPNVIWLY